MNWDTVKGSWLEMKGGLKNRWSKLTDDDLERANGKLEEIAGALQRRYGMEKEQARRELEKFADDAKARIDKAGKQPHVHH